MIALVVDDSRSMRAILSRIVAGLGYEVREAGTVAEAEDRLDGLGSQDLVLVDWNMPGENGLTLIRRLHGRPDAGRPGLLMVTTETGLDRIQEALAAGADEYLMKPFTREAVAEKLALLRERRV